MKQNNLYSYNKMEKTQGQDIITNKKIFCRKEKNLNLMNFLIAVQ